MRVPLEDFGIEFAALLVADREHWAVIVERDSGHLGFYTLTDGYISVMGDPSFPWSKATADYLVRNANKDIEQKIIPGIKKVWKVKWNPLWLTDHNSN